jgi:hypothetical protein
LAIRRYAVYGALTLVVALAACAAQARSGPTDPAMLTAVIDEYLRAHPEHICSTPLFLPFDQRVGDDVVRTAREDELRWLDGLAAAGLLLKARTTAHGTAVTGPTPVDEYVLSDEGRRVTDDPMHGSAAGPVRFCVADTRVGTIVRANLRSESNGARAITVRYRPALNHPAPWTATARTRNAMPWLRAWTQEQLPERSMTLREVEGGWSAL